MYDCWFDMWLKASIVRNAKDTAHTKAERNILEAVKVFLEYILSSVMAWCSDSVFLFRLL